MHLHPIQEEHLSAVKRPSCCINARLQKETGGNTIVMAEENVANLMEVLYEADKTTSFALNKDCLFFFLLDMKLTNDHKHW